MKKTYETVIRIRVFEELILDLFGQNKLSGTTHTYIGQEATASAIMQFVDKNDVVFSNHRCHGHYLAYGGPEEKLLAEIMSKESGLCQGRGGSQHIHYQNFYTNGVQGGIVPNAVGVALSKKVKGEKGNALVFLGDGTLGQGIVYESLNIASIYQLPVMFVIEDNQYAMTTRRSDAIAGNIKIRIEGFDIKTFEIESTDVDELEDFFKTVFDFINKERKPVCAVVHNYRLGAHSKGDDTRDKEEVLSFKAKDPLLLVAKKVGDKEIECFKETFKAKLMSIVSSLENEKTIVLEKPHYDLTPVAHSFLSTNENRFVEGIRQAFEELLTNDEKDNKVCFMGEDIRDPYGGPFKATKGLSLKFNKKILNMPISEACMTGIAVGMGLNKSLPIVEMMFGDFVTLGFDQLLNHASKYAWVYGDGVSVPMILRAPMGAKRGYGPTHSQSLEKFLIGIPQIKVLSMSLAVDPLLMYRNIFKTIKEPTVVIENKKMYAQKQWSIKNNQYKDFSIKEINNYGFPTLVFSMDLDVEPDLWLITYGGMLEDSLSAAYDLMVNEEIQVNVVCLSQLSPLPIIDLEVLSRHAKVIVAEEGTKTAGLGAEIIAELCENNLGSQFGRIAMPDLPIPNGIALESQLIPAKEQIISQIKEELKNA